LFSGPGLDQPAVDSADHILNGNGLQAGLKQVIAERKQADLGANGLGRLAIPPAAGSIVSMSEDTAGSPFGLKLAAVNSTLTGATATGPTGSPASISVDLGATNPSSGDTVTFSFTLPDGSSQTLSLQATGSTTPGANQFTIGATPAATAANLQAALTAGVSQIGATSLSAASALAASDNFFDDPPLRVSGAPATATALIAGTSANTVSWYTGANAAGSIRSGATARIDQTTTVSYGAQANEEAIRWIVQNVATLAATSYSASDPNASANYSALNQRVQAALNVPNGVQKIDDIEASLANAQNAMSTAQSAHQQTANTLTDMLQSIENCSISVSKEITLPRYCSGTVTPTVPGSSGSAVGTPMKSLIAAAMRLAVVKSGLRSAMRNWLSLLRVKSISRSMIAPLAMRPTVGTPRTILAASPSAWKPPMATEPWPTA
jgi:hypothetical protein